ncbi:MAG: nucleotidyltransferase family protein [Deltaproteobacteria bacterium]|nr:nucleotidyltransferase family protein [Deltaproteobacteria bacterium]MBW1815539.1 nucleotidyltransferase family protein [Deltaproteobacteria bacterium]
MKTAAASLLRSGKLLHHALGIALPEQEATLLKACLHRGETAKESWRKWCARVGDPKQALQTGGEGHKRLLPHLFFSLRKNGIAVAGDLNATLRAAYLWEEQRSRSVLDICRKALDLLAAENIPIILLRGLPAIRLYEEPALRHCGSINFLIPKDHLPQAMDLLIRTGFQATNRQQPAMAGGVQLLHESGLPLNLYVSPFFSPYTGGNHCHAWRRSELWAEGALKGRVLNKGDALLHLCCHLFFGAGSSAYDWVLDAYTILSACSGNDLDLLEDTARKNHLETVLTVMLGWLAETLGAPVPDKFINGLRNAPTRISAENGRSALCAACHIIRLNPGRALLAFDRWPLPIFGARACMFPPRDYLRWAYSISENGSLAPCYLGVPARYLWRRFTGEQVND